MNDSQKIESLKHYLQVNLPWEKLIADYEKSKQIKEQAEKAKLLASQRTVELEKENRQLLDSIRDFYEKNGYVGANLKAFSFRFLLGEKSLKDPTVFEESYSRLHPQDPIISLWRTREALAEFERQKAENDQSVFPSSRQRLASPEPGEDDQA